MAIGLCNDSDNDRDWNDLGQFDTSARECDSPEMRRANALLLIEQIHEKGFMNDQEVVTQEFFLKYFDVNNPEEDRCCNIERICTYNELLLTIVSIFTAQQIGMISVHTSDEAAPAQTNTADEEEEEGTGIDSITHCTQHEAHNILLSDPEEFELSVTNVTVGVPNEIMLPSASAESIAYVDSDVSFESVERIELDTTIDRVDPAAYRDSEDFAEDDE